MIKQYRHALIFLLKYVLLYLAMNTAYAWFIESHRPNTDPMTLMVTRHSAFFLSLFDQSVYAQEVRAMANVPIIKGSETVIEVYEGCNSINVMIVFVAFVIAFSGHWRMMTLFIVLGMAIIYIINLLRILALYVVALNFPDALYFFHKFLFTAIIYLIVFALWYWWTKKVKQWQPN